MGHLTDIEEILYEAHAYGMREEVLDRAKRILMYEPKLELKTAYERAFQQIIIVERGTKPHLS